MSSVLLHKNSSSSSRTLPPLLVKASTESLEDDESLSEENMSSSKVLVTSKMPSSSSPTQLEWVVYGGLFAVVVGTFSTYFPFWVDPTGGVMATLIYRPARYHYDPEISRFDNTFLTYGTDYGLVLAMAFWAAWVTIASKSATAKSVFSSHEAKVNKENINESNERIRLLELHVFRSRGLLLSYALSVLAGGIAHQFFTDNAMHNTWMFRFLWTVCVGSVSAASGWMGGIGAAWAELDRHENCGLIPVVPALFWNVYAACITFVVMLGGWSYQRPAADIFVAGITQFPSTFYVMLLVWKGLPTLSLSGRYRLASFIAWILNAPLLPLYPWLVGTQMELGKVNCILHACLCVAWSCQGHVLKTVASAMAMEAVPPPRAVPVKLRNKAL